MRRPDAARREDVIEPAAKSAHRRRDVVELVGDRSITRRSSTPSARSSPIRNAAFSSANLPVRISSPMITMPAVATPAAYSLPTTTLRRRRLSAAASAPPPRPRRAAPRRRDRIHRYDRPGSRDRRPADIAAVSPRRRRRHGCHGPPPPPPPARPPRRIGARPCRHAGASAAPPPVPPPPTPSSRSPCRRCGSPVTSIRRPVDGDAQVVEHALELLHRRGVDRVRPRPLRIQRRPAAARDEVAHAVVLGARVARGRAPRTRRSPRTSRTAASTARADPAAPPCSEIENGGWCITTKMWRIARILPRRDQLALDPRRLIGEREAVDVGVEHEEPRCSRR